MHGWTASGDLQFFTAYEALAAQFSIITFDYRGHGQSECSAGGDYSLKTQAEDLSLVTAEVMRGERRLQLGLVPTELRDRR